MRKRLRKHRRLLTGALLALALVIALSAVAFASTTKVPVWQSGGTRLPYGSAVSLNGESQGLTMEWEAAGGVQYTMNCGSLAASGTAENFAYRKPGTLSSTTYAFQRCSMSENTFESVCVLSQNPTLKFGQAVLSDEAVSTGALKVTGAELKVNATGCSKIKGSWTAKFSGNLKPSIWEGELELNETPVTVGAFPGKIVYMGFLLKNGSAPLAVSQQEIGEGPFLSRHWDTGGAGRLRGEGAPTEVPPGSRVELFKGGTALTVKATLFGSPTVLTCNGIGTLSGQVENPTGGGPGTATLGLGFGGCGISIEGVPCTIKGGGFATYALSAVVSNPSEGAQPALLQLKPLSGSTIGSFEITACEGKEFVQTYTLSGSLYVSPQVNSGSQLGSWTIPTAVNVEKNVLKANGVKTTPSGELTAEAANGEAVTMG